MKEEQSASTLKSLHRAEIAAMETYVQALELLEDDPSAEELTAICSEHRQFANELRQHVQNVGEKPDESSGVWGYWAKAVEGGAQLLGKTAALKALQEGEKLGINAYETALKEPIPDLCKTAIRTIFLPKTREHVAALDQLINGD